MTEANNDIAAAITEPTGLDLYFLLDRSGSMQSIRTDVIGGFNRFLADQKALPGKCRLTLVQFDDAAPFEVLYERILIADVPDLTEATFVPRGNTPLYDAFGRTIMLAAEHETRRQAAGKKPHATLVVVYSDGLENASREYDAAKLLALVDRYTASGWTFAYLGANQDAIMAAGAIGVAAGSTQSWAATGAGVALSLGSVSANVSSLRSAVSSGTYSTSYDNHAFNTGGVSGGGPNGSNAIPAVTPEQKPAEAAVSNS